VVFKLGLYTGIGGCWFGAPALSCRVEINDRTDIVDYSYIPASGDD